MNDFDFDNLTKGDIYRWSPSTWEGLVFLMKYDGISMVGNKPKWFYKEVGKDTTFSEESVSYDRDITNTWYKEGGITLVESAFKPTLDEGLFEI